MKKNNTNNSNSAIINDVDVTGDTLTSRAGLALFVRYLRNWGIYLTQVATTYSRKLPKFSVRAQGAVLLLGRLPQITGSTALGEWVRLPSMW